MWFPLVSYETDSQELILGCDIMYAEGWSLPPAYSYEYRMQPLTIVLVVALRHLVPMLTCEQVYCLLSAFSAFLFLVGCIAFARRITGGSRVRILVAAMLLPEMYAIAMYPNSAIHAAACMVWAFVALADGGQTACRKAWKFHPLLLLCIAPLFRVDVVAVYPAILPLFLFLGHSVKKSIALSAAYGVLAVGVSLTAFWLLRADVLSSIGAYDEWNGRISKGQVLRAVFGFYSLAYLVLLPVGVYRLWRKRLFKILLLVLLPVLSVHFVYRSMGCASKHFLYIAPFVIIAGVYGLSALQAFVSRGRVLRWAAAVAVAAFLFVSVRVDPSSRPWFARDTMYTAGIVMPLCSATLSSGTLSVAIGAGQYVPTEDEYMLATGHFFYPWYIHEHKEYLKRCAEENNAALDTIHSPMVLALKHVALLDVFVIALGFVLRILAGGLATGISLSHWIVLMTFLLSLFLAFGKRRDDVLIYESGGAAVRDTLHRYSLAFINQAISIVASVTIVCYIMYTVSPDVTERLHSIHVYATSLFVLAGIIRYLQLTIVDLRSGSPTEVLLKDRFIHACIAGWVASFAVILYF